MEMDPRQETKSNIKELMSTFSGYSTLHGLHFLVDALSYVRKLIWFLLLCGATAIFVYLAFWGLIKWNKNEVFLTTEIQVNKEVRPVAFPAVTICNKNMMKKNRIIGTDSQRYLDALDSTLSPQEQFKQMLMITSSFNIEQAVLQNGHQEKDIVKTCYARDVSCDFDQSFDLMAGLCYTFNNNGTFKLKKKGAHFGLKLLLDAEPDEYYGPFSRGGVGLSIMVHDQNIKPTAELDGFDVPPGFATNFILTRREIIRQPYPYPSNCGEVKLQSSKRYSDTYCYWEKSTNKTIDKCGCRTLGMPVIDGKSKRLCSVQETLTCAFVFLVNFTYDPNECPPRCNTVKYDIKTSSLVFPSGDVLEKASDDIKSMYKSTNGSNISFHDWYRRRFALVNIFFQSDETEVVREVPAYDFIDFAAGFGGNMGLFLGCSVLTLCEFIDILIVVIAELYKKKRTNTQKISVQPK